VQVNGGTPAYSYAWFVTGNTTAVVSTSENPANMQPGNYTLSVTDAHMCSQTATGTINALAVPQITSISVTPSEVCSGAEVNATVSINALPGSDYEYVWSANQSGNAIITNPTNDGAVSMSETYVVTVTDLTTGCTASTSGTTIIEPHPTIYTVTGNANCGATDVGLDNSQTGVNYQLYDDGNSTGGPVAGSGSSLDFGYQDAAGTYTVLATLSNSTSCSATMNLSAIVYANPTIYTVGGGTSCSPIDVTLSNSEIGVNYQLYIGANATGSVVAGTGSKLDFGSQLAAGTYTVVATNANTSCTSTMTGSATVNSTPTVYNVTGGTNCGSTTVGLDNSDIGVSYQLYNGLTATGAPKNGVGSALSFGPQTEAGVYTVIATATEGGCTATMNGTATVNAGPTAYNVTGGTNCGSTTVGLDNSDIGISYQLYNGLTAIGSPENVGGALSFGPQTEAGVYTVKATPNAGGCSASMSGSATVNANPNVYTVHGGTHCGSSTISLSNSQSNVNYQLLNGATTIGSPVSGSGPGPDAEINFGTQTTAGTYTVVATNAATGCTADMSGSSTVNPLPSASISTYPSTTSFILGSSLALTASSATSYTWSTSEITQTITVTSADDYAVTITDDNGCSASASVTINCAYAPDDIGVTLPADISTLLTNPFINGSFDNKTIYFVNSTSSNNVLKVDQNLTLTNCHWYMSPGSSVLVKSGAELDLEGTISGTTITPTTLSAGCANQMWQGIEVQLGGEIVANKSYFNQFNPKYNPQLTTISDALYGIQIDNHCNGSNCNAVPLVDPLGLNFIDFNNNFVGFYAPGAVQPSHAVSSTINIDYCNFNGGYLKPLYNNETRTNFPPIQSQSWAGIDVHNAGIVYVGPFYAGGTAGCSFANLAMGVKASFTTLYVKQSSFDNIPAAANPYSDNYRMSNGKIDKNDIYCCSGITSNANSNQTSYSLSVQGCYVSSGNYSGTTTVDRGIFAHGVTCGIASLWGNASRGIRCSATTSFGYNNLATDPQRGSLNCSNYCISVDNSPNLGTILIESSTLVLDRSNSKSSGGAAIILNNCAYTSTANPPSYLNTIGYYDIDPNTITVKNGGENGIVLNGCKNIFVYQNQISMLNTGINTPTSNWFGINITGGDETDQTKNVVQDNVITGSLAGQNDVLPIGVNCNTISSTVIECNDLESMPVAAQFNGDNLGVTLRANIFNNYNYGLYFPGLGNVNPQILNCNHWDGSYISGAYSLNPDVNNFEVNSANPDETPPNIYSVGPTGWFTSGIGNDNCCSGLKDDAPFENQMGVMENEIAQEQYITETYPDPILYDAAKKLYTRLVQNDSLLSDSLMSAFYDSVALTNMGLLDSISRSIASLYVGDSLNNLVLVNMRQAILRLDTNIFSCDSQIISLNSFLSNDSSLIDSSQRDSLSSMITQFVDTQQLALQDLDSLIAISDSLDQLANNIRYIYANQLSIVNNSIIPFYVWEYNMQTVYGIYLNTLALDSISLNDSLATVIFNIAQQCPWSAGSEAVYLARSMYSIMVNDTIDFVDSCPNNGNLRSDPDKMTSLRAKDTINSSFNLFPNPTNNSVTLTYKNVQATNIICDLYDVEGHLLYSTTLNPLGNYYQINLSSYSAGILLCRVWGDGVPLFTQPVVIIK
jgi:hypothetical protein